MRSTREHTRCCRSTCTLAGDASPCRKLHSPGKRKTNSLAGSLQLSREKCVSLSREGRDQCSPALRNALTVERQSHRVNDGCGRRFTNQHPMATVGAINGTGNCPDDCAGGVKSSASWVSCSFRGRRFYSGAAKGGALSTNDRTFALIFLVD